ncbi:hypothetical protein [Desulfitobacterium metallireducens]|uniref:Uncharacterized protein n=1 Tax=Desulfitobacterium metallireducens DSM 15288 TaxID=871968 RepID=W0EGN8_9FIRM|nr:hypothetical protein [Desulfitobacterium metallireducens]AHF08658.1 hypothetical protein DESME_12930 [Desulfitobacterium metallireducens DSM 15288]
MKKSIAMTTLLMGLLLLLILTENQNKMIKGKINNNSSNLATQNSRSDELSNTIRKSNFLLGGGETGRIEKQAQERKDNSVNNSLTGLLPNAKQQLFTATYDGSAQATHPSVIDFKLEYHIEKWNGYRYWMVFTPYPNSDDKYENPSILSSNDGLTWVVPPGFEKPLDIKEDRKNFNSDPSLLYDKETNTLNVFWREVFMGKYDKILRIKISEKGNIAPKVLMVEVPWTDKEGLALSPTVWKKSSNEWYMWTANGSSTVHIYTSSDGVTWSKRERCSYPWLAWNGGYVPWHLEVKPNYGDQKIEFFIAGFPIGKGLKDMSVFYAEAPMSDPKKITMPLKRPLLTKGNSANWDGSYVYRASFTIDPETNPSKYHVWYAAMSQLAQWRIGYTEGEIAPSE